LAWLYREQGKYAQAEELFRKAIEVNPENYLIYRGLAVLYEEKGEYKIAEEYYKKAGRTGYESSILENRQYYLKFKDILDKRGVKLICAQSPMRRVELLKELFKGQKDIIFVDNEKIFKAAVKKTSYAEYFYDAVGGDYGHCTLKGNRLLAENIANTIIKEVFKH
jgi:tetratricopeptide (TPR) repeat protein